MTWYEIRHEFADTIYWIADKPAYFKRGAKEFYKEVQLNLRKLCDPFKIEKIKKKPGFQSQVFVHL
jgi:hypothetical protein